ncbi:hypothetical protein HP397_01490 [Streptobacillus felis]|uniref:Uncharacterized protein n=1 Tax=Streptobacillus felis TaxID=1384509 RepID=A0A7Z0T6R7_9FUSO|nr:hypothetical protein [Streptobacillus felis]NYV27501.1 hypothetical protein [Streptobacillus felis]
MRKLCEYKDFESFLDEFKNYNEKPKYFKIDMEGNITTKEPSYILEYGYMYLFKEFKDVEKVFEDKDIFLKKEKKVSRHSNVEIPKLKESFFRAIFNRDEVHSLSLANELIRRDTSSFFDIIYLNSKLSDDENRLIKAYLFEKIYLEIGLTIPLLRNLIGYFCKSKEGYGNKKKVDELYSYIYRVKFNEEIKVNVKKMSENKKIILKFLEEK